MKKEKCVNKEMGDFEVDNRFYGLDEVSYSSAQPGLFRVNSPVKNIGTYSTV